MAKHEVMGHIIEHCRKVAEVGVFIAWNLRKAGTLLNIPLIEAASLVHDIAKMRSLHTGDDHAKAGAILLEGFGWHDMAAIVRQHVHLAEPESKTITEAAVVNYADKRVLHTSVVSLTERFAYIREKYGQGDSLRLARIDSTEQATRTVEARIFADLAISPKDITL